jgi:hypothetical protein
MPHIAVTQERSMDMNRFFERRHSARAESSESLGDNRDSWTLERSKQIVEALAGVTADGRGAVYPSTLMVKPNGSGVVGSRTHVSVFEEFGWWLGENSDLLTPANTRDLLTCPIRIDVKLFREFAVQHAEMECSLLADDYFSDDRDWEAA